MKKWIIPCLSLFVIAALIFISSPYYDSKKVVKLPVYRAGHPADLPATLDKGAKVIPAIFGKMDDEEEKEQKDSNRVVILKKIAEALDGWLKSINERIESEDVTKIEVRFLEILRSILEWIKEKIDAKIESSPPQKQQAEWLWSFRA
jgi:uncharacterized protein (DUF927 family)